VLSARTNRRGRERAAHRSIRSLEIQAGRTIDDDTAATLGCIEKREIWLTTKGAWHIDRCVEFSSTKRRKPHSIATKSGREN
jgi:hypothetical protein